MILLKITIILFVLWIVDFIACRLCYAQLGAIERMIDDYPVHMYILSYIWLILGLGWVGCLIATIILW